MAEFRFSATQEYHTAMHNFFANERSLLPDIGVNRVHGNNNRRAPVFHSVSKNP